MIIEPKIDNLSVGQEIKNYKELCAMLDISTKTGKSKQIQMKKLEEFIKYHKVGNRFIIDEIIRDNVALVDKRIYGNTSKTTVEIGDVILHKLLTEFKGQEISLTTTELLYRMMFITDEYRMLIRDSELYHILTGIDYNYLNSYKLKIGTQLNKKIERALKRLKNSGYILYDRKIHLKFTQKINGKKYHYVKILDSERDKQIFIDARLKAFKKLNKCREEEGKSRINDMSIVFIYGEFKRFRRMVCKELNKKYPDKCTNFWEGYVITTTKLALNSILDDERYNKNLEFVKSDFFKLLERNTKDLQEKEIIRLEEQMRLALEQENAVTHWGEPFYHKCKQIECIIQNVISMNNNLIYN